MAHAIPGCPSLTCCRPGVFFTINSEGAMEAWDYYYKQKDPVLTVRGSHCWRRSVC